MTKDGDTGGSLCSIPSFQIYPAHSSPSRHHGDRRRVANYDKVNEHM